MSKWYNPIICSLLRSPLHRLISSNMLLISYVGRKSGTRYTIPVSYVRANGSLLVISYRKRVWWCNLVGGAPVDLWLAGRHVCATATAIVDEPAITGALQTYVKDAPGVARYLDVTLDEQGNPRWEDVERAAQGRVVIGITLS